MIIPSFSIPARILTVSAVSLFAAASTQAAERLWTGAVGTPLDFQTGSNWNPAFSGTNNWLATDGPSIANGGTANLSTGTTAVTQLVVGGNQTGTNTGTGTLNQSGGALTLSDGLVVARQGSSVGTYNMTGGTLSAFNLRVGGGSTTSNGTYNISGLGTSLTTAQTGTAGVVGIGVPGTGVLTISNSATWSHTGSTVLEVGGDNNIINGGPGGNGTLNILSGASVSLTTADMAVGRNVGGTGSVVVNGGSLTLSGATAGIYLGTVFASTANAGGTGTLTLTSGTVTASKIALGTGANMSGTTGSGTINFNGGTAIVGSITKGTGSGTVNFNGTTIQASASSSDFYAGLTTAGLNIQSGGQIFDTNGNAVTITQGMSGTGGLTKKGGGTLKLSGASTFTGGVFVQGGSLQLGVSNALAGASNLTLSSGTLDLNGFSQTATGTLNLTASSTIDFGSAVGANSLSLGDSSALAWTGSLTLLNFDVVNDTLSFTSSTGLTAAQLNAIAVTGYQATGLSPSGVVQFTAVPENSSFGIGIAGLLVMATILRRRRALA